MPIYEYQCAACQHRFEILQKMSEAVLTDCPKCHQSSLTKLVSAAAFRLKGQGWYETDFKSSNQKGLAGDSKQAERGASDASATKTDAGDASSSKESTVSEAKTATKESNSAASAPAASSAGE